MRERAATDFSTNLIVLAGAGTGKTSLLIERMLVAIGSGIATLPQIAAITFTEMAAGELHARLSLGLTRLHARATGSADHDPEHAADRAYAHLAALAVAPEAVAQRALDAFDALPGAAITTIHGFCVQVLRGFPREAGLPPGFSVDAAGEGAQIFDEAWADFLQHALGPDGTDAPAWNARRFPNSRASAKASGRLGSYFPVSIAFTVCRETSRRSASSACDHPRWPRSSRTRLRTSSPVAAAGEEEAPRPQHGHGRPDPQSPADLGGARDLEEAPRRHQDRRPGERTRQGLQLDAPLQLVELPDAAHHHQDDDGGGSRLRDRQRELPGGTPG